jgi:hypothetical protein
MKNKNNYMIKRYKKERTIKIECMQRKANNKIDVNILKN